MRARCPNCKALFRLAVEDLELADGLVRCGQCLCVFHATPDDRGADQQWVDEPDAGTGEVEAPNPDDIEAAEPTVRIDFESDPADTELGVAIVDNDPDYPALHAQRNLDASAVPPPADELLPDRDDRPELMLHELADQTTGRYVDTDYAKCIGCHICRDVCPSGYIQMGLGE